MYQQSTAPRKQMSLNLDYRIVCLLLLAAIVAMLIIWKPWHSSASKDRTVQVTGAATLKAEPDEYVFSPSYSFTDPDKQTDLTSLTAKSNELVTKLKGLSVDGSAIKTNANNWDYPVYEGIGSTLTYKLQLNVTIDDKTLAQKVQDYLLTTNPSDALTPNVTFSIAKQKALQSQARDEATKDARAKADQSAKNLGFKVANVKTVQDGNGFNNIMYPMMSKGSAAATDIAATPSLTVQPGQNDLNYSVTVTYYIK